VTAQLDTTAAPFDPTTAPFRRPADPDPAAYVAAAWLDHHDRLVATLLRDTRDPEVAADIAAETFEAFLREVRAGRLPDNEAAWLHRVARNRVIDWSRRRARWAGHGFEREEIGDDPATSVLRHEQARELHRALACLPEVGRRAVVLQGEGYKPAEIATLIGRTNQATRTLLCRARRRVASELEGAVA
jgi:RNA polymerase sigma factor (sigma-70 family)